jgi:hypothetical protein
VTQWKFEDASEECAASFFRGKDMPNKQQADIGSTLLLIVSKPHWTSQHHIPEDMLFVVTAV